MNLPLPSGSSPAEKPPLSTKMWHLSIMLFMRSIEAKISSAVRSQNTLVTTFAPARSNCLAVS